MKLVPFSEAQRDIVRQMRGEGCTWDTIARRLRVDRHRVCTEASRMGLPLGTRRSPQPVVEEPSEGVRRGAEALPAGHPVSWGAIHQPWVEDAE